MASRVRGTPGDGLPPERILGYFLPRLFGECGAPEMIDDLVALVEGWRPELVVYESTTFAAPLAAAHAGVPAVHHTVTPLPDPGVWALCGDAVSPLWRSLGLDPPPMAGLFEGLTLATFPPSLDTEPGYDAFDIVRLRPEPLDAAGGEQLPDWVTELPDRPTVYMTLGTIMNTDVSVFRAVLDGLADEPVNVIVTVGHGFDPASLGTAPANARIEHYVPQSLLFAHCDVVISHAGSGTTLGALAFGLPQLMIPQGADNFINAERCAAAGAAVQLLPDQVSTESIREHVTRLLDPDSVYHRAADDLRIELEAMATPQQWVDPLHSYARGG
jgi:hypothetical protein